MEDCTFGPDCPCNLESISGEALDLFFERHPEKDLRGKEISFAAWDGFICPLLAAENEEEEMNAECIHHDGLPCDMMIFCMTRDGGFEETPLGNQEGFSTHRREFFY